MQDDDEVPAQDEPAPTGSPRHAQPRGAKRRRGRMRRRRTRLLLLLVLVFLAAAVAFGVYWWLVLRYYASTEDAYVHGNKVMLTAQISGTVVSVGANNTDLVRAGQVVVKLDQSDTRVALAHAEAKLAQTVRNVRQLLAQEQAQKQRINQRQVQLAQARRDFQRDQNLLEVNGVSREQFQHSNTALKQARYALATARHKLEAMQAMTEGTDLRHNPQVKLAEAQFRKAYLAFQRTAIPAPVTGTVAISQVQVGQRVTPATPMMAIVPLDQLWVQANFKETAMARIRIGQPVILHADFYGDDVTYHGTVVGTSAGTGSAFELLPPQNATGNWIKVVRRVPVRIRLRPEEIKTHPLRLGLSMSVAVDLHDTSGRMLVRAPSDEPAYTTDVYDQRMARVRSLIDYIVSSNAG
ncbi:MAG: HlyD family efflux transporter periplasmic adaptor subunit, partial [Salinisphaera sp.]|nr:HlyD family efflux transporter periplasmic adaptor subunit [Salinisphaera sp.]